MDQILIAVLGIAAIWLTQDPDENRRKYACLFGIVGQPFWFYSTWIAGQWGIFILTLFYTIAWLRGIKQYWWRKNINDN